MGDVAEITAGGDINKGDLINKGKYPVIANGLNNNGIVGYSNKYKIDAPAVTITGRGTLGVATARFINFTPIVRLISIKSDLDPIYLENVINNTHFVIESTGVPQLTAPQVKRQTVILSNCHIEQTKIGSLLSILDNTITLHEEKKRQLERLKIALLQKMFANKNGYPAVRFEGFSNEWEHCKLGDVADITTGSRNHQDSVTDGKYPFFVRSDKVERLNEYDFDTKAILVPGDGRIGEIFHYYNGKFALHQRVYKVDNFNGINELFLLGLFKYSFKEHALRLNAQGTVPSLRLPMFTNWSISVPMITEQERIGVFFQKLERTISLYDHKLELLKKVKRSMLQVMFI